MKCKCWQVSQWMLSDSERLSKRADKSGLRSLRTTSRSLKPGWLLCRSSSSSRKKRTSTSNSRKRRSTYNMRGCRRGSPTWSSTSCNPLLSQLIYKMRGLKNWRQSKSRLQRWRANNSLPKVTPSSLETEKSSLFKSLRLWLTHCVVSLTNRRSKWTTWRNRITKWSPR